MKPRWPLRVIGVALVMAGAAVVYRAWPPAMTVTPAGDAPTPGVPRFTNITESAGVHFSYFRGETSDFWLTETTGGGVALIDYDGDGWLDIFFVNGCKQPVNPADFTHTCKLMRNGGDGTFSDMTPAAGVGHNGYGQGCAVGDFDNDGFDDLYVTCVGSNVLYHNNGDGTIRAVTSEAGVDCPLWSTGAAFGDFDRDGDLDLFVANYVDFDPKTAPSCGDPHTGQRSYCGPNSFGPLPDVLFENNGDGTFSDVSTAAGINLPDGGPRPESKGLGVQVADLDHDGWLDIFVANDQTPNFLFHNAGGLKFREVGMAQGVALTGEGATTATMGVACGDYDADGRLDLFTTNFYLEGSTLYRNLGQPGFRDVTATAGLAAITRGVLGWGTGFIDFDNDGWLDLFASNGHVQRDVAGVVPYAMPAQVFRNTGQGILADVSSQAGPYFIEHWNGRGAAFGDIDNDGDTDIVVVHHHQPAAILRNDTLGQGHYLRLKLIGLQSDRNALGAKVIVTFDGSEIDRVESKQLVRHVSVSGSYLSSSDARLLIGLGTDRSASRFEVRWNTGRLQYRFGSAPNREVVLREQRPP